MRVIASIFILILLSGCSMDEQLLSVLKINEDDFTVNAYEEPIKSSKEKKVREILNRENWQESKFDLNEVGYPGYKFFFNKHINKIGTKIAVYSVWISKDGKKVELTKDNGSKYMLLDRGDSEIIVELITTDHFYK